ncbi:bacteriophage N4 adsorption protein A [Castellaniella sp.]|uniref:bacteriophage N4 adsorption protein A n=1 Tax=Castellaniella sp. TaxID=1955812 RepID=UPI002AFF87F2|nr:tetratricopeptide repeat protein [Castellaniella sp.]
MKSIAYVLASMTWLMLVGADVSAQAAPAVVEQPLQPGGAWVLADQAFKAYDRRDFPLAAELAQQSIRLQPSNAQIWLLRVYALQNMGQIQKASEVADDALSRGYRTPGLLDAKKNLSAALSPRKTPAGQKTVGTMASLAYRAGVAAYKAYEAGQYEVAESKARQSLRLQPRDPGMQGLLVYALERQHKVREAASAADIAVQLAPEDQALLALRDRMHRLLAPEPARQAWRAYQDGNYSLAAQKAREAVREAPDIQSYYYLLAGSLLKAGQFPEALAVANQALEQDNENAMSLSLQGFALMRLGRDAEAGAALNKATAADWLSEQETATVKKIAADTLRSRSVSSKQAGQVPGVFCTTSGDDILCGLLPVGFLSAGGGPGYAAASRAYAALAQQRYQEAAQAAHEASLAEPDNIAYRLLESNALSLAGDQSQAQSIYRSIATDQVPPSDMLGAAYGALRISEADQAKYWFMKAVDAEEAGDIELEPQQKLNVRQAVSDLDRTWGANLALGYGTVGVMNPAFAPSLSDRKTLQSSEEIYWRPPVIGNRDGSTFEVYARLNQALYDGTGGATGWSTTQGAVGARWKPFKRQNFVFAVERLIPVSEHSRSDTLLRAAWSAGEGGSLRADKTNWPYWSIYAEGDYFIEQPQTIGVAEARYGRAYRVDSASKNLMVIPFLAVNAGYDDLLADQTTVGAGPGVLIRKWFREDKYHAPQSFVDFTVQYRFKVLGGDRSEGIFAGLYFAY